MAEMNNVICPVCCAQVAHEGRIMRGSATEFAKCAHGSIGERIELWLAWKRADAENVSQAVSEAVLSIKTARS